MIKAEVGPRGNGLNVTFDSSGSQSLRVSPRELGLFNSWVSPSSLSSLSHLASQLEHSSVQMTLFLSRAQRL